MWSVCVVELHVTVNNKEHRVLHNNLYDEFMPPAAVKLTYIVM